MNYSDKSFVISTHVFATGPAQDLKKYLLDHDAKKVFFIGHPLFHDKRLKGSAYEIYEEGQKTKECYTKLPSRKINLLDYILHIFRSVLWVLRSGFEYDLYVGSDNVNAMAGVILKRLGRVRKNVYYVIDYNPHRFSNKLMNSMYHWADRICVKNCDETWNLSARMEEARKEYFGFSGGNQKVVPIGVWLNRIHPRPFDEREKHTAVFMGHVTKKQGVQYVIGAMPEIIKFIPDFKLLIIGDGDYLPGLKELANKLDVSEKVDFKGYVENAEDVEILISKCAVAVALYDKYDDAGNLSFTYFADPAKIKLYLACGLEVLTSAFVSEMEQYKPENLSNETQEKSFFANSLIDILKDDHKDIRLITRSFVKSYDWEFIFNSAISTVI